MSALARSAVALYPGTPSLSGSEFYSDKHQLVTRRLKLTLTGQGGLTNTISGGVLGFSLLTDATNLWDSTNSKGYPTVIDPVNNLLILLDGSAAPAPVDVTATAYVNVTGYIKTGVQTFSTTATT